MTAPGPRVVLIGAPGAGKSSVGRVLAQDMDCMFVDTDTMVEEQTQRTVAEIFIEAGEAHFRELEARAVAQALQLSDAVVALGGGAVLDPRTQAALTGLPVVWLQVSVDSAVRRVGMQAARPLLLGNVRSRFMTLLAERTAIYALVAAICIDTDGQSPDAVADEVRNWLATRI